MKDSLAQFIKIGLIILGLSIILAWLDTRIFEPNRMPPCQQDQLAEHHICLEKLLKDWSDKIVWIDARNQNDFEVNHLRLPDNRMFQIQSGDEMQQQIDAAIARLLEAGEKGECVVVFCSMGCSKANDVAAELRQLGLIDAPVFILERGWDAIKKDNSLLN